MALNVFTDYFGCILLAFVLGFGLDAVSVSYDGSIFSCEGDTFMARIERVCYGMALEWPIITSKMGNWPIFALLDYDCVLYSGYRCHPDSGNMPSC